MAVADPSGTLPEGQICVLINGVPKVQERVLVYKAPGCHTGDVRCVSAVAPPPALQRHLNTGDVDTKGQSALIISTRGRRSLTDEIAGSDIDGDVFTLIWNQKIVERWPQHNPAAWEKRPTPQPPPLAGSEVAGAESSSAETTAEAAADKVAEKAEFPLLNMRYDELDKLLVKHYARCCKGNKQMVEVALAWKAHADANPNSVEANQCALFCEPARIRTKCSRCLVSSMRPHGSLSHR